MLRPARVIPSPYRVLRDEDWFRVMSEDVSACRVVRGRWASVRYQSRAGRVIPEESRARADGGACSMSGTFRLAPVLVDRDAVSGRDGNPGMMQAMEQPDTGIAGLCRRPALSGRSTAA
jgi:hypothetical protein